MGIFTIYEAKCPKCGKIIQWDGPFPLDHTECYRPTLRDQFKQELGALITKYNLNARFGIDLTTGELVLRVENFTTWTTEA